MRRIFGTIGFQPGAGARFSAAVIVLLAAIAVQMAVAAWLIAWGIDTAGWILLAASLSTLPAVGYILQSLFVRRRAADAARDEQFVEMSQRLELAMEVSQVGFWDVDLDTDALRWDARACAHMGVPYRDGHFTEADWLGAVHPEDRGRAVAAAEAAIESGGRFISDYRVVWPSGEVRHLRDMAAHYYSSEGRPRIAGLIWDVTADKDRETELEVRRRQAEAADKAKSSFLAAMSHEIRTPLGGVIGMLDLMLDDELPESQVERARIASASAHSLLQLLNDVLDVSKLEAASMTLSPVPIECRRLIGEVADLMAARAAQKGLQFGFEVAPEVPSWVVMDPVRFRQVLSNIVSNAITYTDNGFVSVEVGYPERDGWQGLEIVVRDSGIGIPEADIERIFERFVQTEASSRRQSGGTGLGLAIARELVELMSGRIGVASREGGGSTFTFSVRAPKSGAPEGTARAGDRAATAQLDILVAEDNATNRFLISSLLGRGGHRVTLVENGRKAIEAIGQRRYDLVLMDVQMPIMDGLEATRAIRQLEGPNAEIPIVALTASVLADDRERYRSAGMDDCLAKPIDIAALDAILSRSGTQHAALRPAACG